MLSTVIFPLKTCLLLCAPLRPRVWQPQERWNTHRHRGSGGGGHSSTEAVYGTTHTASQTRPCQNTDSEYLSHRQRCFCEFVCLTVWLCVQMCALVPWEKEAAAHSSLSLFLTRTMVVWMRKCVCLVLSLALGTPVISFCLKLPLWEWKTDRVGGNQLYLQIKCICKAKLLLPWCGAEHRAVFNSVLYEAECVSVLSSERKEGKRESLLMSSVCDLCADSSEPTTPRHTHTCTHTVTRTHVLGGKCGESSPSVRVVIRLPSINTRGCGGGGRAAGV